MKDIQRAYIISDIHIGSRYCLAEAFERLITSLPEGTDLILNGDVVDHLADIKETEQGYIDLLRQAAESRRVVWVRGNHDKYFAIEDPGKIEFVDSFNLGKRLFIVHGHRFYKLRTHHQLFKALFAFFYKTCIRLGAKPGHIAFYAKRFPGLFNVFRQRVARNAIHFASNNGYSAITCGHVHYPEEFKRDGIHYINTGSWTEEPIFYLKVDADRIELASLDLSGTSENAGSSLKASPQKEIIS